MDQRHPKGCLWSQFRSEGVGKSQIDLFLQDNWIFFGQNVGTNVSTSSPDFKAVASIQYKGNVITAVTRTAPAVWNAARRLPLAR